MKKILIALLLSYSGATWAGVCATNPSITGTCGPTTSYTITLLEVALCRDAACTSEYVVGSGAKTFDIASVAVGASVGSYASFDTIPPGTYTHMRSVVSRTFGIVAPAITDTLGGTGRTCPAQNGSLSLPNGVPAGDPANPDALAAAGIAGLTWKDAATHNQIQLINALTSPITITQGGKPPTVSIKFGTTSALACYTGFGATKPIVQAPEMSVTITP